MKRALLFTGLLLLIGSLVAVLCLRDSRGWGEVTLKSVHVTENGQVSLQIETRNSSDTRLWQGGFDRNHTGSAKGGSKVPFGAYSSSEEYTFRIEGANKADLRNFTANQLRLVPGQSRQFREGEKFVLYDFTTADGNRYWRAYHLESREE